MNLVDKLIAWLLPDFRAYHYPPPVTGFLVIKAGEIGITNDRKHFTANDIRSTKFYIKSRGEDKLILIDLCNGVQVEGTNEQLVDYLDKRNSLISKELLSKIVYTEENSK